jgi:hypothetical protein
MFKTGFLLNTFEKLAAAIHNQSLVEVWLEGDLVEDGGIIISQTAESVLFIGGSHMMKASMSSTSVSCPSLVSVG